jgi:uncharacterized coiled-coil protein SlyX
MPQIQMSDIISPKLQEMLIKEMTDMMATIEREMAKLPKEKRDEIRPLIEQMKDTKTTDTTAPFQHIQSILNILQK